MKMIFILFSGVLVEVLFVYFYMELILFNLIKYYFIVCGFFILYSKVIYWYFDLWFVFFLWEILYFLGYVVMNKMGLKRRFCS